MKRSLIFGLLVAFLAFHDAYACAPGDGDRATDALANSEFIAIVRIESLDLQDISRDPMIVPYVTAKARVVEVLKGAASAKIDIRFIAFQCGGVDLRISGYYLAILANSGSEHEIKKDDERVFALAGEYSESEFELVKPKSSLLDSVREYISSGKLPPEEVFWSYYGKTKWVD